MITESQWYLLEPMNDMPVYSFVCPDCVDLIIQLNGKNEMSPVENVDPIKQCCVCRRQP